MCSGINGMMIMMTTLVFMRQEDVSFNTNVYRLKTQLLAMGAVMRWCAGARNA